MDRDGAYVIVLGNEKGGSGKSTTAFHLAIYLLYEGFRVASIDVDSRQQTFTHTIRNRMAWAEAHDLRVPHPIHFTLPTPRGDSIRENGRVEFELFREALREVERQVDFLIIDTPGFDTNLARIAHSLADTLITPFNDSLIDLDVLARIDPVTGEPREVSHYARLVQRGRKERLAIDGQTIDWVLVRNRISMISTRNMRVVQNAVDQLALRLACRVADGISERVIFRTLFPIGMTVFDPVEGENVSGVSANALTAARAEYRQLAESLKLPVSPRAAARRAARAEWERGLVEES